MGSSLAILGASPLGLIIRVQAPSEMQTIHRSGPDLAGLYFLLCSPFRNKSEKILPISSLFIDPCGEYQWMSQFIIPRRA